MTAAVLAGRSAQKTLWKTLGVMYASTPPG
jgi:hypothetical protein